jgi:hypothetical protein
MAKQSSVNLDITNNADGFDISGGTTVRKLGITGGDITIAGSGSATVTFPTTSTTIAGLGITQSFSALQSFSAGISAAGGVTLAGTLQGTTANFTGLVSSAGGFSGAGTNLTNVAKLNTSNTFTSGSYLTVNGVGMFAGRVQVTGNSIIFTEGYDDGTTTLLGQPGSGAANTVSLPQTTGTVALTNSTVASFNGLTGAVTGVTVGGTNVFTALNTFNAGISASGATFSGDIAVNGGDITTTSTSATLFNANATTLDILNTQSSGFTLNIGTATSFSGTKRINIGGNLSGGAISEIIIGQTNSASKVSILGGITLGGIGSGAVVRIASPSPFIVDSTSTLSGSVTMSSTSSHTGLASFAGGLSASGATFSGSVILQNQEFIRNTTNGRMDFMPAPLGSTQFGMYMDFTSWSYGVKLGTIRSSDGVVNTGNFLWESPLSISPDVQFNLGSDGQYNILRTAVGNDTAQFSVNCSTGQNSGAFAIVDSVGQQQANRSPGVTHANPNLYVYRAGSARATDFIRIEHDGTNGRIVSGGTSGISIEPGSGVVGISGGMCASGMVVLAQGVSGGYGNDVQSYGYTSGYDIIPTNWQSISANITASPDINSIYLASINISKKSIIKSIATQRGSDATGNTGNFYLGLYNSNLYGLPNTLVYSSPSSTLGTGNFGVVRVSNVNYTANPGAYWIGIVFSAAGLSAGLARYGGVAAKIVTPTSSSPVGQSTVTGLTAATSGFTLPTNLNNVSVTNVIGSNFPAVFFTAEGAT